MGIEEIHVGAKQRLRDAYRSSEPVIFKAVPEMRGAEVTRRVPLLLPAQDRESVVLIFTKLNGPLCRIIV